MSHLMGPKRGSPQAHHAGWKCWWYSLSVLILLVVILHLTAMIFGGHHMSSWDIGYNGLWRVDSVSSCWLHMSTSQLVGSVRLCASWRLPLTVWPARMRQGKRRLYLRGVIAVNVIVPLSFLLHWSLDLFVIGHRGAFPTLLDSD